jgi:hypothetical protein
MNSSANIDVDFGSKRGVLNCHPTWETRYFDYNKNVIKDFREVQH